MTNYRVFLKSVPGPFEQYDGYVDVWSEDEQEARYDAVQKLRRTSFPDRALDMWKVTSVEARP